jgi:sugar phosphate isomerase/epimerase
MFKMPENATWSLARVRVTMWFSVLPERESMIKPCFSTVACPEWTLDQLPARARELGFESVELRVSWESGKQFACDPLLSSTEKARGAFQSAGVEIACIATGLRFDEPVMPPVIGYVISDTDRPIRWGEHAVDVAVGLECPLVRVFGFQGPPGEKRSRLVRRVSDRLKLVCDHANKTGVRVVVENGGAFARAEEIRELIEAVGSPLLGVSYSLAAARLTGEDPAAGIASLRDRLWIARVKDVNADGVPCALGTGMLGAREFTAALSQAGCNVPLVFEWDRAWNRSLAPAAEALAGVAEKLVSWAAEGVRSTGSGHRPTTATRS